MRYEWDEDKNILNFRKHGFDFKDAAEFFEDIYLTFEDNRFDYGEKRFIGVGFLKNRMVIIVYIKDKSKIRIISIRKANEREQKKFGFRLEADR